MAMRKSGLVLVLVILCAVACLAQKEEKTGTAVGTWEDAVALHNAAREAEADARVLEAIELYEEALSIVRALNEEYAEAIILNDLGDCYRALGDYARAILYYEQSLAIRLERGDRRNEASILHNLGDCYHNAAREAEAQSRFLDAIELYEEALSIFRALEGKRMKAVILNDLGDCYYSLSDYARAMEHYEQSLAIFMEIGDRAGEAISLNNLGKCYSALSDYTRAIEYHEQSLVIEREIGNRGGEAASLNNLGNCYYRLSDYARAIEYHEQSLAIKLEIGDRRGEAASLNNLGLCYEALSDCARAMEHYEQSLAIKREIGDRRGEAASLNNLGICYEALSDYARAIEYFEQSLAIFVEIGNRRGEAASLGNLGGCYSSLSDYARAMEYHEQSLAIDREIGNREGEAVSLNSLGNCYRALGDYPRAMDYQEQALALAQELGTPETERYAHWNLGRTHRALEQTDQALVHYEQALTIVESIRSRVQEDELRESYLEGVRSLYEEYLDLLMELDRYEDTLLVAARLQALIFLNLISTRPEMARESAPVPGLGPGGVEVDELRAALAAAVVSVPEDTAVLEYFVSSEAVRIWVTTSEGTSKPLSVAAERAYVVDRVISFRRELEKGLLPSRPPASEALFLMARELYELLIEPVVGSLEGKKHLVIIPSGPLFYVPFAALYRCAGCEGADLYHGGIFMVEEFTLSYAPSLTTLKHSRSLGEEAVSGDGLLALVDPDGSLPGARGEAEAISGQFCDPHVYVAQDATEEAVRLWAGRAQHVLFSTHGVFNARNPMYSYLLMHPAGEDDGRLHTYEVFGLALRADLVTLSACETLLPGVRDAEESFAEVMGGDEVRGMPSHILDGLTLGDELVGLTRAFIQAGAQSVLATHWSVFDESTQRLMVEFYTNLLERGMNKAQALREAQLHLLRQDDSALYRHPVYWAAFGLYGDWE